MRVRSLLLYITGVAACVLASVACGASAKQSTATPASETVEQRRTEALTRSSANATNATSFTATFHADVTIDEKVVPEDGSVVFRAPASVYMKLTVNGQQTEILLIPPDEYINLLGKGWYNLGDVVLNKGAYAQYAKSRGPVDYAGVVGTLTNTEQLAAEEIDGQPYDHYTGTFDLAKAIDSVPADIFQPGVTDLTKSLAPNPGTAEVWVDPKTDLPRRMNMTMDVVLAGKTLATKITMDYTSWNADVTIPAAPQDAKPYAELTGGLSPADLAYLLQFSGWLTTFGNHASSFGDLLDGAGDSLTADEQTQLEHILSDFDKDRAGLAALRPTDHFQPSYDKYVAAVDQFKIVFDEAAKEAHSKGSADRDKGDQALSKAIALMEEATKLFKAESPSTGP